MEGGWGVCVCVGGGGGGVRNDHPEFIQNSTDNIISFSDNYNMQNLTISSWWMMPSLTDPVFVIRCVHCVFFSEIILSGKSSVSFGPTSH